MMQTCATAAQEALSRLVSWLKKSSWESYDPYDYKAKPELAPLLANPRTALLLQAAGLGLPKLTRKILRVVPTGTASGYAYLLSGFSRLAAQAGDSGYHRMARKALDLLLATRIDQGGWGLPFDWQTPRGQRIPKNTTLSYTTYTGLAALLDYYDCTQDAPVLALAGEIALCTPEKLNAKELGEGTVLSYSIYDDYEVVNTNALLGSIFCRLGSLLGEHRLLSLGCRMLHFVTHEQNSDGSWNYFSKRFSAVPGIDNYHSAMTLRGVAESVSCIPASKQNALDAIKRGLDFYETAFLDARVFPALWPHKAYPKDIACIAEGILLYEALLRHGWSNVDQAQDRMCSLLLWGIENMQKRAGHFLYRKYPMLDIDLRSIRWGQGMMLLALSSALPHFRPFLTEFAS